MSEEEVHVWMDAEGGKRSVKMARRTTRYDTGCAYYYYAAHLHILACTRLSRDGLRDDRKIH